MYVVERVRVQPGPLLPSDMPGKYVVCPPTPPFFSPLSCLLCRVRL